MAPDPDDGPLCASCCCSPLWARGGPGGRPLHGPHPGPRGAAAGLVHGYEPRAGDIVIASKTTAEPLEGEAVVKRAVALAGQTVELDYREGRVLVDGQALAEPYLLEPMALPQKPEMQGTQFQVEADSLFLLGDNRNGSTDSRHSGVGSVHRDCLLGRAVAVIWPLDHLRLL